MRKALLISLLVAGASAASLPVVAQPKKAAKSQSAEAYQSKTSPLSQAADRYFKNGEYFQAAEYYRQAIDKNPDDLYARFQLAECYRNYFDYARAEETYGEVVNRDARAFPLAQFWYGSMLKVNNRYAEARQQFQQFVQNYKPGKDQAGQVYVTQAQIEMKGCDLAERELMRPKPNYDFGLMPAPVNTANNDYAPATWKADSVLVITSARVESKGNAQDPQLGEMFSDLFVFGKQNQAWVDRTEASRFNNLNTKGNDGTGVFNRERTKFYFTSCNTATVCQIMVSELKDGRWTSPATLNNEVNAPGYTSKQPAISRNGDTLFFVSDRPGGKGMNDIWFSTKAGGENWGVATNLAALNTPFNDMSPAVAPAENALFFASNGREGFGGLDIYVASGPGYSNVANAGLPFNSSRDDFYMVLDPSGHGFLTSNRQGGLGGDDIYDFSLVKLQNPSAVTAITDKENADRSVVMNQPKTEPLPVEEVRQPEPEPTPEPTPTPPAVEAPRKKTAKELAAEKAAAEKAARAERAARAKQLADEKAAAQRAAAEERAARQRELAEARAAKTQAEKEAAAERARVAREARAAKLAADRAAAEERAARAAEARANASTSTPRTSGRSNRGNAVSASDSKVRARQIFESIYFNFDESGLRPEAEQVMADLATYLNENPEAKVEVQGYTDWVGTSEYNKALAQRRVETATGYLTGKGIASDRLQLMPQGEGNPMASNGNRAGRRLNRRVEFHVLNGRTYTGGGMVYISETSTTAEAVARKFGMTADEVKAMNGMSDDQIGAYEPIRVKRSGRGFVAPATMSVGGVHRGGSLNR